MKMIKLLALWGLLFIFGAWPHGATAQEERQIQQLHIQVMPEFDDPRVLVIVQGQMGGTFPQSATFLLPSGAQINQMAILDVATGQTLPQEYTTLPDPIDPRWLQVTYQLEGAHFFYEFYYDPLNDNEDRQFTYLFKSLLPVADLLVEVQAPLQARNFALTPVAGTQRTDGQFGFVYHQFQMGRLPAGQDVNITVRYTKTDPAPSISREELMGGGPENVAEATEGATAVAPSSNFLSTAILSGLIGFMALILIGRFFWLRRRSVAEREPHSPGTVHTPLGSARFCPRCGTALQAGSRFCHACGAPVTRLSHVRETGEEPTA